MREIYILATEQAEPLSFEQLQELFAGEDVELVPGEGGLLFSLKADEARVDVRFLSREEHLGWTPELLTGSEECHAQLRKAKGFYRIAFEPGKPQASVAVFEALWTARMLMEHLEGVLLDVIAFKLHDAEDVTEITELEFDIRDHINLHAVEVTNTDTPLWVHSHGMEKFGARDVEVFHIAEEDLQAAESFFHELCTDLAFGQGPAARSPVGTSEGQAFMLLPSEEARLNLFGLKAETFEGHEGRYLTVVSPDGRHNVAELLRPYRERFEGESEEEASALAELAKQLLPAFKARFLRRGLMEPMSFLVRAPFEAHPNDQVVNENLWLEVLTWEDAMLVGKLVDGGTHTTEWRKGTHVEIEEAEVNALALSREGRTLDPEQMRELLLAEKPA